MDLSATEEKIIDAALVEFIEQGLSGARTQSIAERAGVNKALVHYYFRSKNKLYSFVIRKVASGFIAKLKNQLSAVEEPLTLRRFIEIIVRTYINTMATVPAFPQLLIRELMQRDAELPKILFNEIFAILKEMPERLITTLKDEIAAGRARNIDPIHIVMNIMGMCASTFIVKPVMESISKEMGSPIVFDEAFYETRIKAIVTMACDGLIIGEKR